MGTPKKLKTPKFKSGLERNAYAQMPEDTEYEPDKIKYVVEHSYTPDFKIGPNTYIETKGRFLAQDRAKHLYIKEQHPEVTIHFLFGNAQNKLNRASKTSYADWCEKYGFSYADFADGIPQHWFNKKNKK
jgi:Phage endonuclease I